MRTSFGDAWQAAAGWRIQPQRPLRCSSSLFLEETETSVAGFSAQWRGLRSSTMKTGRGVNIAPESKAPSHCACPPRASFNLRTP